MKLAIWGFLGAKIDRARFNLIKHYKITSGPLATLPALVPVQLVGGENLRSPEGLKYSGFMVVIKAVCLTLHETKNSLLVNAMAYK